MLRTLQTPTLLRRLGTIKNTAPIRTLASVSSDLESAYDVVIIGGGVAGVTLACSLGNKLFNNKSNT
jgi:ubiquinone biosynthesis monooxygenase Coq6